MPSEEWKRDRARGSWCEYLDLSVSWIEDEDWPESWMCPECEGHDYRRVHRDYSHCGLRGTRFSTEVEWRDEEGDER